MAILDRHLAVLKLWGFFHLQLHSHHSCQMASGDTRKCQIWYLKKFLVSNIFIWYLAEIWYISGISKYLTNITCKNFLKQ